MLKEIYNNPYRILGVYSNSQKKEQVANKGRMQAFLRVNKPVHFPLDLEGILPELRRTQELVDYADSELALSSGQIKHAQFWFINITPVDSIAFNHLTNGNIDQAIKMWKNSENISSLQNLFMCHLIKGEYETAITECAIPLYHQHASTFVSLIDKNASKTVSELVETIVNVLSEEGIETLNIAKKTSDVIWKNHIESKKVNPVISQLELLITDAKSSRKNGPIASLTAGRRLMDESKILLDTLKSLIKIGDTRYQIIADRTAQEVLQCGIDYHNGTSDYDKVSNAMTLQQYALDIAVGELTKSRCEENVSILKKEMETLPPDSLISEDKKIRSILNDFLCGNKDIEDAIQLIIECCPYLASIKELQGSDGAFYRFISTQVEEACLSATISEVNLALERTGKPTETGRYLAVLELHNILKKAWESFLYMGQLDIEAQAQQRFNNQRKSLLNLLNQAGIQANNIWISFKFQTEAEIFNSCETKSAYYDYIRRFPDGKYTTEAQRIINELEYKENLERHRILTEIANVNKFATAISLYSKCKELHLCRELDDKCFSLCKNRANFKKYLQVFGSDSKHLTEAESHTKLNPVLEKIKDFIEENKGWTITISIAIFILIAVGLIWGLQGYLVVLRIIGVISGFCAFAGLQSKDGYGCGIVIIGGIIAFLSFMGADKLDEYIKDKEAEEKEIALEKSDFEDLLESANRGDLLSFSVQSETMEKCSSFLSNHPNSTHMDKVMEIYYYCAQDAGVSVLENFANTYGRNEWGVKAAKRVSQICDSLYDIAYSENTIQGWKKYQAAVTYAHYKDSSEKIEELENEAWSTDAKAWKQATIENTLSAYQRYIRMYPHGHHKYAADKKIIDIQVDNVYQGEHDNLPAMNQTGYGGGSSSDITIYNNTSYTLTLLYSGNESKRLVISPKQTKHITLRNGNYRIAASVDAPNVGKFAGLESLHGGAYSVEYYIVTTKY